MNEQERLNNLSKLTKATKVGKGIRRKPARKIKRESFNVVETLRMMYKDKFILDNYKLEEKYKHLKEFNETLYNMVLRNYENIQEFEEKVIKITSHILKSRNEQDKGLITKEQNLNTFRKMVATPELREKLELYDKLEQKEN